MDTDIQHRAAHPHIEELVGQADLSTAEQRGSRTPLAWTASSANTVRAVRTAAGPVPVDVDIPTGLDHELTTHALHALHATLGEGDPMTKSTIGEHITTNGSDRGEPPPSSTLSRADRLIHAPGHTSATNPTRRDGPSTRTRLNLPRLPWLTATVFALTTAGAIAQQVSPSLLDQLQRLPAGLHGQWWRSGTALFVQDGGLAGLVSNLIFLAAIGTAAEQVCTPRRWLVQYFGTGLLAELVGYAWQPIGGGNSIAICGLASAVAVTAWRDRARLAPWVPSVVLVWCGALLAYLWEPLMILGILAGVAASRAVRTGQRTGPAVLLGVLLSGVVLAAAANIHGAALLIGVVLALLRRPPRTKPKPGPRRPAAPQGVPL